MRKFETIYRDQRLYIQGKIAGCKIKDQKKIDNNDVSFQRMVYQSVKQAVQEELGLDVNTNAWVFDQNQLKTIHTGRETLKSLCYAYYIETEAGLIIEKRPESPISISSPGSQKKDNFSSDVPF